MIDNFENTKIQGVDDLSDAIKNIEFLIRHSKEYRSILRYLKEDLGLRYSLSFPGIDFVDNNVGYEMHHIINLYNIVYYVGADMLANLKEGEYLLTFDIAKKVMELHLEDKIPMIMLSTTEHQLYHTGNFSFDKSHPCLHMGKSQEFIDAYHSYMSQAELDLCKTLGLNTEYEEESDS